MAYPFNLINKIPYIDRDEESFAIVLKEFDGIVRKLFEGHTELEEYLEFVYRQNHTQKEYCMLKKCTIYKAQKVSSTIRYQIARYARKTMCFKPFTLEEQLEKRMWANTRNIEKLKKENEEISKRLKEIRNGRL